MARKRKVTKLRHAPKAGIHRVKGVKKLGVRLGNWLTVEQATALWQTLLACGLRRHEAVSLEMRHIQRQ